MSAVPAQRFVLLLGLAVAGCAEPLEPAVTDASTPDESAAINAPSAWAAAFARRPEIVKLPPFPFEDVVACDGFDILVQATLQGQSRTYFDRSGNPVTAHVHINWRGIASNTVTGKSIEDNSYFTLFIDLATGTQTFRGINFRWTIPGEGIVVLDAGQIQFAADGSVNFIKGPHQSIVEGDDVLCAVLD